MQICWNCLIYECVTHTLSVQNKYVPFAGIRRTFTKPEVKYSGTGKRQSWGCLCSFTLGPFSETLWRGEHFASWFSSWSLWSGRCEARESTAWWGPQECPNGGRWGAWCLQGLKVSFSLLFMLLPVLLPLPPCVCPDPAVGFPLGEWLKQQQAPAVLDAAWTRVSSTKEWTKGSSSTWTMSFPYLK